MYRQEYPRPQFVRDDWKNLNGKWEFEIDHGNSGKDRKLYEASSLADQINVPFCPESELSGIGYKDFMAAVWYRREFDIPENWKDKRILLHFGAVDYETTVWINGKEVGKHRGGYTPFSFEITDLLKNGNNVLTVNAVDDNRSGLQPRGKQSAGYYSAGCDYTRTTGIWQTVWLEAVPKSYIKKAKYISNPKDSSVNIELEVDRKSENLQVELTALYKGTEVGNRTLSVNGNLAQGDLIVSEVHLWEPGKPELYDLEITLLYNGQPIDHVSSYFGMRTVSLRDKAIYINEKPVFQRLVLDQGFYPDGIYTAPSDEALKRDIELSMELGFNGARLHEKVFEPRFLYWADQMGYLVWGEHANWGLNITNAEGLSRFLPEWIEAVDRDFNSPALVGWCPFNETWDLNGTKQDDEVLRITYEVTKALDKTRPVIDTSGNFHVVTDIFDIHDYEQDVEKFAEKFRAMGEGGEAYVTFPHRQRYEGQPYFVSEYGGIWWQPGNDEGWGYGNRPKSEEEFLERYKGLTETLLKNKAICAFCYTQLYDVEQEVNGLYTYERKAKFDPAIIRAINSQRAAIEEEVTIKN
ncbi:sugar-binding domain-containing protein [Lederbergia graminis]|uniref:Glycoside hydrolase family 2 protein n=1 Tax=Lederbergia graminis TaxID=735518 RepID=A0ABW0LGC0_9BACI|nr:sugar-binding domain-containing protein [Paenibacillus bovis]